MRMFLACFLLGMGQNLFADSPAPEFVGVDVIADTETITGYVFKTEQDPAIAPDQGRKFFEKFKEWGYIQVAVGVIEMPFLDQQVFAHTDSRRQVRIPYSKIKKIKLRKLPFSGRKVNRHWAGYISPELRNLLKKPPVFSCVLLLGDFENFHYLSYNEKVKAPELEPMCHATMQTWKELEEKVLKLPGVYRVVVVISD